ncbi:hypothetical protein INR49_011804 [Caranx melampygus]|nr:hypothetical protein INR49_011804 [Caranx melampygus]
MVVLVCVCRVHPANHPPTLTSLPSCAPPPPPPPHPAEAGKRCHSHSDLAMVETVNNLLQPQAQAAWRELSTGEQLRAATMLLDTVEQGAFVLADNLLKTDIVQENTDNILPAAMLAPAIPHAMQGS